MTVKFSKAEKASLNRMKLIFGRNKDVTQEFFASLAVFVMLEYLEKREIVIPLLGKLVFKYQGDEFVLSGRQAVVDATFEPDQFMIRNVGQVHDEETTDAERILLSRIRQVFASFEEGATTKEPV